MTDFASTDVSIPRVFKEHFDNYCLTHSSGSRSRPENSPFPRNVDMSDANISATSISEITSIPRATCIRKLEKLVRMNILEKNKESKRYFLSMKGLNQNENFDFLVNIKHTIGIISQFSSVIFKGLFNKA